MSGSTKALEPAFQGAGQRVGTEIWRIENFQPIPLPKSDYGRFYSGDSYIVLQTTSGKGGALSNGGVASGFKETEEDEFQTRLYTCKGKRVVRLKQVPFSRSALNHDDVFILYTKDKIFQFNGANSNIQERAKALEVIQFLKEKYHDGTCDVAIVDDGKLQAEGDSGEFWVIFGGFAPIGKKVTSEDDIVLEKTAPKLYCIPEGQVKDVDGELSKSLLENNKCYLLDCGSEVSVWVGRVTQVEERKAAMQVAEEFIVSQNRPKSTRVTRLIQGYETHLFKSNFESWPSGSAPSAPEEGRGKVAALLKQQGVGLKGLAKSTTVTEEVPPLLEENGKIEVWRINGSAKTPVPKEDIGKFYSGDCYIVLYTYHSSEKKEDYYLCCWIGKDSIEEDQNIAARLTTTMFNSLKGRPVQGRAYQGKEPPQFVAIFQPMVVLKGGLSSGYKNYIADKGLNDETYSSDSVALIQISGTSVHNNKAVQVEAVATSLNTYDCFLLQSGSSLFTWHGNQSTVEQHSIVAKIAEILKPGVNVKFAKEGTENSTFWFALGGKQGYTSKRVAQDTVRDPHLFAFSFNKGKFEIEEIYNFSQDDLLTEDILILDTHIEVFVWVGQSVDSKEKQTAFEIGQKYVELAASLDGLSPCVPLYRVTEGNEPTFFTTFFSWDSAKANAHGNSFQKKLLLMFGFGGGHAAESQDKSNGNQGGPTQRASALAALNSAFQSSPSSAKSSASPKVPSRGSQRAAAVAALSSVLTAEKKGPSDASPVRPVRSPPSERSSPVCDFFRKPKNKNIRKRTHNDDEGDDNDEQDEPSVIITKKKLITPDNKLHFSTGKRSLTTEKNSESDSKGSIFQFDSSKEIQVQNDSRATATLETETDFTRDARAIRERALKQANDSLKGKGSGTGEDEKLYKGINGYVDYKAGFRREQTVASEKAGESHGPLRASAHIRVSARFDYQPDICKDYKETGYCGYGDSCKFMHDRGDYKSGWQMENEWDEAEKARKKKLALKGDDDDSDEDDDQGVEDDEDGLPFACFICRQPFVDPVVTKCKHYFCEHCALN